jgi:hypothetical protein
MGRSVALFGNEFVSSMALAAYFLPFVAEFNFQHGTTNLKCNARN